MHLHVKQRYGNFKQCSTEQYKVYNAYIKCSRLNTLLFKEYKNIVRCNVQPYHSLLNPELATYLKVSKVCGHA